MELPEMAFNTASWGGPWSSWKDDDGVSLREQRRTPLPRWKGRALMVLQRNPPLLFGFKLKSKGLNWNWNWNCNGSTIMAERSMLLHAIVFFCLFLSSLLRFVLSQNTDFSIRNKLKCHYYPCLLVLL